MADFDFEEYIEKMEQSKRAVGEIVQPSSSDSNYDGHRSSRRESDRERESSRDNRKSRRSPSRSRSPGRRSGKRDSRERGERQRSSSRNRRGGDKYRDDDRKSRVDRDAEREIERARARDVQKKRELERDRKRVEEEYHREQMKSVREVDDLTKDQRTVFVGQLTVKVTEDNLKEFFGQLGTVNNIIMIRDKHTGKHKGFAYVEMAELDVIPNCLLFNNMVPDFQKFPILVKASEAEKNFVAKKDTGSNVRMDVKDIPDNRLYIANIHVDIDEITLQTILEQFGPIELLSLHRDDAGASKGFAFATYKAPESASLAAVNLSGLELVGKALKVGPVFDQHLVIRFSAQKEQRAKERELGQQYNNNTYGNSNNINDSSNQAASANWKLDDDDGSKGMQMNSQNRAMLMAKLGQAAGIQVPHVIQPIAVPQPMPQMPVGPMAPPVLGNISSCFVINNMFEPSQEVGENWDLDIRDDVSEECRKYGTVEHCFVDKHKPGGLVYLKFSRREAASQAANSMNGRFFAGRMIRVTYLTMEEYHQLTQE